MHLCGKAHVGHKLEGHHDVRIRLGDSQNVYVPMPHVHEAAGSQHTYRRLARDIVCIPGIYDVAPKGSC